MTCPKSRSRHADLLLPSGTLGLFLAYLEILRAHRSSFWYGMTSVEWLGFAFGLTVYTLVVLVLALILRQILLRLLPRRFTAAYATWSSAAIAALTVWAALCASSTTARNATILAGALAILSVPATIVLADAIAGMPTRTGGAIWIAAAVAGFLALIAANHWLFLHANRASLITRASVAWAAVTGSGAAAAWAWTQRKRPRQAYVRLCILMAACLAAPLVVLQYEPQLASARESAQRKPSVLLITADALRADYCSLYGGAAPAPTLESLAKQGAWVEHSYALAPWTIPSVVGLIGSQFPRILTPGADRERWDKETASIRVPSEVTTLAECLAAEGYATAAFVGNYLLSPRIGVFQGFERRRVLWHLARERRGSLRSLPFLHEFLSRAAPAVARRWERPIDTSMILTRDAVTFLRRCGSGPFFLWVHYMDPHEPYNPPKRYRSIEGPWPLFSPGDAHWGGPQYGNGITDVPLGDNPDAKTAYVRSLYAGEIRYMDWHVGQVLNELAKLGRKDDTYVLFTSDHGEELWDRGRFNHGHSLYEEQIRVPLICAGPGIAPRLITTPLSAVDVIPTLAELVGVETDHMWHGQSLAPILLERHRASASRPCPIQGANFTAPEPLQAIISETHKLIRGAETERIELYDLRSDPKEQHDLCKDHPELAAQLRTELSRWTESFPTRFDVQDLDEEQAEMLQRLRAVGYLGDE